MSALTPPERSRVLYHLGYLNVAPAASLSFGIPRPIQTMFLVETAMTNLVDDGFTIENVRRILGVLDRIDCQIAESPVYFIASKSGNTEIDPQLQTKLEYAYCQQMGRLADILGVPAYPYSQRAQQLAALMNGVNIRVRR